MNFALVTLVVLISFSATAHSYGKPGKCTVRFFPAQVCEPYEIINTCHGNDYNCPGSQKCCQTGRCVTSCEEPEGHSRGRCPDTSGIITTCQFTKDNCLSDAECPAGTLCCSRGCGSECLVPVY